MCLCDEGLKLIDWLIFLCNVFWNFKQIDCFNLNFICFSFTFLFFNHRINNSFFDFIIALPVVGAILLSQWINYHSDRLFLFFTPHTRKGLSLKLYNLFIFHIKSQMKLSFSKLKRTTVSFNLFADNQSSSGLVQWPHGHHLLLLYNITTAFA